MTTARLATATAPARTRTRWGVRTLRRLTRDAHVLLAVGLVLTSLTIVLVGDHDNVWRLVAISIEFVAAQAIAALAAPYLHPTASQRLMINIARFVLAILYVATVTALLRTGDFRPAAVLFIPVVALAAAQGSRQALVAGVAAIALYLLPVLSATSDTWTIDAQRAVALGGTALLLSIGTRRSISALTVTVRRLTTTLARDRRRSRQVEAVESVGRLLASTGPDSTALERIVSLLGQDLGYDFVSVYLGDETRMQLAAQRGYDTVIDVFDGTSGVIGRVMRTKSVAFVPDVSADADYRIASGIVQAELCAPMLVDGHLVGIVNVEDGDGLGLDESDVGTMTLVADRLASALALAGERERLAARVELFRRLTSFATAVNGTLDPDRLNQAIVERILEVVEADSVGLTILDRSTGQYVVRAVTGPDKQFVGLTVEAGIGLAGRAIRDRAMVIDERFEPSRRPILAEPSAAPEPMAGAAAPLIRDDVVVGALTVLRHDVDRPFAANEVEALPILAGLVALAITNTFLHMEVTELSVRDALTGLFNRRHLDVAIGRMEASRSRRAPADREAAAAIIFDLDHFGAINKRYGHHTGDQILRAFADILRARFRGADLVARYGGEEFVAILERATPEQAAAIADEVRLAFADVPVPAPDGTPILSTVSAGCAGMGADQDRFADILGRADVGLVMAKRAGRNRVITA